jgi:hypothetical protein
VQRFTQLHKESSLMLATYSQYSPQGLVPQIPGLLFGGLGAGVPPTSPVAFAPTGAYTGGAYPGSMPFGYDSRQAGLAPYPFAPQLGGAFAPNSLVAPYPGALPYGAQPHTHTTWLISQLAQQVCAHAAIAQQTGIALYQLAAGQHAFGGAQPFAMQPFGTQPFITQPFLPAYGAPMGTPFAGSPFGGAVQSGYGGVSPQLGASWGTSRPPTIQ